MIGQTKSSFLRLNESDNVAVALQDINCRRDCMFDVVIILP